MADQATLFQVNQQYRDGSRRHSRDTGSLGKGFRPRIIDLGKTHDALTKAADTVIEKQITMRGCCDWNAALQDAQEAILTLRDNPKP